MRSRARPPLGRARGRRVSRSSTASTSAGSTQRGVGGDRQIDRGQRLKGVRPAPERVVVERDRDHLRAPRSGSAPRACCGRSRRARSGSSSRRGPGPRRRRARPRAAPRSCRADGGRERSAAPATRPARSISGAASSSASRQSAAVDAGPAAERLDDDQRDARLDQPAGDVVDGVADRRAAATPGESAPRRASRTGRSSGCSCSAGVEAQVDRAHAARCRRGARRAGTPRAARPRWPAGRRA